MSYTGSGPLRALDIAQHRARDRGGDAATGAGRRQACTVPRPCSSDQGSPSPARRGPAAERSCASRSARTTETAASRSPAPERGAGASRSGGSQSSMTRTGWSNTRPSPSGRLSRSNAARSAGSLASTASRRAGSTLSTSRRHAAKSASRIVTAPSRCATMRRWPEPRRACKRRLCRRADLGLVVDRAHELEEGALGQRLLHVEDAVRAQHA